MHVYGNFSPDYSILLKITCPTPLNWQLATEKVIHLYKYVSHSVSKMVPYMYTYSFTKLAAHRQVVTDVSLSLWSQCFHRVDWWWPSDLSRIVTFRIDRIQTACSCSTSSLQLASGMFCIDHNHYCRQTDRRQTGHWRQPRECWISECLIVGETWTNLREKMQRIFLSVFLLLLLVWTEGQ